MPYPIRDERMWKRQVVSTAPGTTQAPPTSAAPTITRPDPPTTTPSTSTTPTSSTSTSTTEPSTTPTSTSSWDTGNPNTNTPTSRTPTPTPDPPPNSGSNPPPSNTPAPTPIVTTSMSQSVFTTVLTVTDGNGVIRTTASVTSSSVPVLTTQLSNTGGSESKSNTAAIVGGVIGGIAGLGLLILLLWCMKRRNKEIKLDENIFDPDRNVQRPGRLHGDVDLAAAEARPYSYQSPAGTARATSVGGMTEMSQVTGVPYQYPVPPGQVPYGTTPYPVGRPTSQYGHTMSPGPSDGYPDRSSMVSPSSAGLIGAGAAAGRASYPPSTTDYSATTTSQHPHSAKGREAAARNGLQVANIEEDGSSPVVQHQDGGRVEVPRQDSEPAREVPPAYDSIQHSAEPSGSAGAPVNSRPAGDVKRA